MIRSSARFLVAFVFAAASFPLSAAAKVTPEWAGGPYPALTRQAIKELAAEALQEAEKIRDPAERERAWPALSLAEALAIGRDFAAAKAVAAKLEQPGEKDWALLIIAVAQAGAGDTTGAKTTAKDCEGLGLFFAEIVKAVYRAGDRAGAEELAARCTNEEAKAYAYIALAEMQVAGGDKAAASGSLRSAGESAVTIGEARTVADALTKAAGVQTQGGDVAGAKATLKKALAIAVLLSKEDERNWACMTISEAQATAGDIAGAKATTGKISRAEGRNSSLGRIAALQAKAGDIDGARATLKEMAPAGIDRSVTLRAIAVAQADHGDLAAAKATIAENDPAGMPELTFPQITRSRIAAKDFAGAQAAAELVKNAVSRNVLFEELAVAQKEAGDAAEAKASMTKAKAAVQELKGGNQGFWLMGIVGDQIKIGDLAGAQVTAEEIDAKDTAKVMAFGQLARARAEAGDRAGAKALMQVAREVAEKVDPDSARANPRSLVAHYLAVSGDVEGAIQTIRGMSDDPKERVGKYGHILEAMILMR